MKKILLTVCLSLLLGACSSRTSGIYDDFARCLTEKGAKMYGADTCPHCLDQKNLFGNSFDLVAYIECRKDPKACLQENIEGYPTWIINEEKILGTLSLAQLAELTKCPLNP